MPYELYIYDKSSFSSGFDQTFDGGDRETGSGAVGETLTTSSQLSGITVSINDNDASFNDDPNFIIGGSQTLAEAVTINGVTYPAGSNIEMGFVADANSTDGVSRMYSIKINNDIVGVSMFDPDYPLASVFNPPVTAGLEPNTTYTVFDQDNGNGGGTTTGYDAMLACFTKGTLILTPDGERAIEDLQSGDWVETKDNGPQQIRWIGSQWVSAKALELSRHLRPIRIQAGALGDNSPQTDLIVSPQHRVLVRSRIAERMFGQGEVLVAAKQLLLVDGIDIAGDVDGITYFHFMFDDHQVVVSNGAETESLYTGPEALKSVGREARQEILELFPELIDVNYRATSARILASGRKGRKLAHRHVQNHKDLVNALTSV